MTAAGIAAVEIAFWVIGAGFAVVMLGMVVHLAIEIWGSIFRGEFNND